MWLYVSLYVGYVVVGLLNQAVYSEYDHFGIQEAYGWLRVGWFSTSDLGRNMEYLSGYIGVGPRIWYLVRIEWEKWR